MCGRAANSNAAALRTWRWRSSSRQSATTPPTCARRERVCMPARCADASGRAQPSPKKPLVVSLHGPPGVGKTFFHKLLAEAVYNMTGGPGRAAACESGVCACAAAARKSHRVTRQCRRPRLPSIPRRVRHRLRDHRARAPGCLASKLAGQPPAQVSRVGARRRGCVPVCGPALHQL